MITDSPVNNHKDLLNVLDGLLGEVGLDRKDLGGKMTFAGMDPIRPTRLKVGCASAAITGANAVASALIWKKKTDQSQDIHIDLRKAYVTQSAWQDTLAKCTLINGTPHMVGQGPLAGPVAGRRPISSPPGMDVSWYVDVALSLRATERVMRVAQQRHAA